MPLRSPITRDARGARCGFSSLRRVWERVERMESAHIIAPQEPQNNSLLVLSFCMLH